MADYSEDYLLGKRVKIFQPTDGYRAAIDAVFLAAAVDKMKNGDNVLDVGSGTGAVSLCLAERFKEQKIFVTGLEIQTQLAELANLSAQANGFDFITFLNRCIEKADLPFCSFSHVISNPPYSENDLPSPKSGKATAHNFSHAGLAEWIRFCIKMIKPQGNFYMINRTEALDAILHEIHGKLGNIQIFPLYSKNEQNAKRIIIAARKDSKAPTVIRPPLVIHTPDGGYTLAAEQILREGKSLSGV